MEHSEAQNQRAAERYMLGDLTVSEVEEFERHFFDCPQCSEELRTLTILRENARAVFVEQESAPSQVAAAVIEQKPVYIEQPSIEKRPSWFSFNIWAPALAMLAIAVFAGFKFGERGAGEPQSISSFPVYAATRGSETIVGPAAGAKFFTLYMDRTWERDFASYRAAVRVDGPSREEKTSIPIPTPAQGASIQLLFPAQKLSAGRYILTIFGKDAAGNEAIAAEYPFTLRVSVH